MLEINVKHYRKNNILKRIHRFCNMAIQNYISYVHLKKEYFTFGMSTKYSTSISGDNTKPSF